MAKADYLPNLIRDPFPDGSATTTGGKPAPNGSITREDQASATGASAPSATARPGHRRYFIGGSDVRIIMGDDEAALLRLWREKRGEVEAEDLSTESHCSAGER